MTRRKKILFIAIPLFFLMFGVIGYLFISSEYFLDNYIKDRLRQALQGQINGNYEVDIDKLRGNVLTGVEIENLSINEKNSGLPPILSTEKVVLKYHIFPLLRGKILVSELEIESPNVNVVRNSDGDLNLTEMLQTTSSETKPDTRSNFAFAVAHVKINEGSVRYSDSQQSLELNLPNISFTLEGPLEKWKHSGSFSIGKGSLMINETQIPIEQLDRMQFAISNENSEIPERYTLKLGNSSIDIIEFERAWRSGDWKTEVRLKIDAKDVQKFIHKNYEVSGAVSIGLSLNGTNSTINGSISCESDLLSFRQIRSALDGQSEPSVRQIDLSSLSMDTSINIDHDLSVTLNEFKAIIAGGTLTGKGNITYDSSVEGNLLDRVQHFLRNPFTYESKWSTSNIQLPALISMLVEMSDDMPKIDSGTIIGSAEISGNTERDFHLNSTFALTDTYIIANDSTQQHTYALKDSTLACEIVSETGKAAIITANGTIDTSAVAISGSLANIDVQLKGVDFGKLCKISQSVPFTGIGNISATIAQDGTASGYVEIPRAYFGNLKSLLGSVSSNFRYKANVLSIENGSLSKNSQNGETHIAIDGSITLAGKMPSQFAIIVNSLVLDDDYNNIFFQQAHPITGTLSGELNLSGFLIDNLDGQGTFTVESGNAWGIHLDTATLPLEIEDYALTIPNFVITAHGQQVILNTHVTPEGEFDFSLMSRQDAPVHLAQLARAADVSDFPLDGKMDVNITSYLKKPENVVFHIDLHFTDLTFENNPLGNGTLHGVLVENGGKPEEPNYFQWTGTAFEGTSTVTGKIFTTAESPYEFILHSEDIQVAPILRIFDSRLENISGTAVATTKVTGTVTELMAPSKKRQFPYDVDINIQETELRYNAVHFTNTRPIHLKLENDILTIVHSALHFRGQPNAFVELTGTFDTNNETVDISAKSQGTFSLAPVGTAFGYPLQGHGAYQFHAKGPLSDPHIELNWQCPTFNLNTPAGTVDIQHAHGTLTYQNGAVNIAPWTLEFMQSPVQIGGRVHINKNDLTASTLHFDIRSDSFDIAKASHLLTYNLSPALATKLGLDNKSAISGKLGISAKLHGNIVQPILTVSTHTKHNTPLLFGSLSNPISVDKLSAEISIKAQTLHVQDAVLQGKMGDGVFDISGTASQSTLNSDDMHFDLHISANKMDFRDFFTRLHQDIPLQKALVSGTVQCSGTGMNLHQMVVFGKIDELHVVSRRYTLRNTAAYDIRLAPHELDAFIPLQITSPDIDTHVDISIDGKFDAPTLSIQWRGDINSRTHTQSATPFQWIGRVDYNEKLIKLSANLTHTGNNLDLTGTIPFDLSILEDVFIAQFTEDPINIRLTGNELPLNLFPGLDTVFSHVTGVADINLALQGTMSAPHLHGTVAIAAPTVTIKDFPQTIENVNIHLKAQKDSITLTTCDFDIADGTVSLQQDPKNRLTLSGITPKKLEIYGLTLHKYPLTPLLKQTLPPNYVSDIEGTLSATLEKISIPLDRYVERADKDLFPTLHEFITYQSITQQATADFTIDNIACRFTLLDQSYDFENPQPIRISLVSGEFKISELKLENTLETGTSTAYPLTFSSYGKWRTHSDILLNMRLDNFDLSSLNSAFPQLNAYKLNGFLSTNIKIEGTHVHPEITLRFHGDRITLNNANLDEFTGELQYSAVNRHWSISQAVPIRLRSGTNELTCIGRVPYALSFTDRTAEIIDEPIEIILALNLGDIGILSDIAPQIESANGVGTLTATVYGTPAELLLSGAGDINLTSMLLADSPIYLQNTRSQFVFSESVLRIPAITGTLNDGAFFATGQIRTDWFNVQHIDLVARLESCNFSEPGQYFAKVSTGAKDLRLQGDIDLHQQTDLTLSGDIIIHAGHYEQNWENVRDWFRDSVVSDVELTFGRTLLDNLQLDLDINIPEDFHFLSSLGGTTDIEIACNGHLTGLIQKPIFTGDVTILKGKISMITQEFDIVEGSMITNQDDTAFNPQLDIVLKTQNPIRGVLLEDGSTADLMITATVSGVLPNGDIDKAKLNFQADPINSSTTTVFSEASILSLLLPGSSISRSFGGITFTISSGFDPNERHIIAEYPLPKNMSIRVEGDERGDFGIDVQLLERRF